uniref:Uncharacterized protein n=1 Tax=Caenorhabditis japonica TaxID=281687 RepID=A0A8R1ETV2_CAEJA
MSMLAKHRQSLDIPKNARFGLIRFLITLILLISTIITIFSLQYPIFPFYARFRRFHYKYTEAEKIGLKIGIWALIPYSVPIFLMVRYVWRLRLAKKLEIWRGERLVALLERGEYGWRRREVVGDKKSAFLTQIA